MTNNFAFEFDVFPGTKPESEESEAQYEACQKNKGHESFIPVPDFDLEHIPKDFQNKRNLEWIRIISELTVRLRVNYTSNDRPDTDSAKEDPRKGPRVGTGRILNVYEGGGASPCEMPDVVQGQPWWGFNILTAGHVIFDTSEAKMTLADLFYDKKSSLYDGRMKTLKGIKVLKAVYSDRHDWCVIQCISYDRALASQINWHLLNFWKLRRRQLSWANNEAIVIISHPHGQPKKVTFGTTKYNICLKDKADAAQCGVCFIVSYSADTCPGSSGAAIMPLIGSEETITLENHQKLEEIQQGSENPRYTRGQSKHILPLIEKEPTLLQCNLVHCRSQDSPLQEATGEPSAETKGWNEGVGISKCYAYNKMNSEENDVLEFYSVPLRAKQFFW